MQDALTEEEQLDTTILFDLKQSEDAPIVLTKFVSDHMTNQTMEFGYSDLMARFFVTVLANYCRIDQQSLLRFFKFLKKARGNEAVQVVENIRDLLFLHFRSFDILNEMDLLVKQLDQLELDEDSFIRYAQTLFVKDQNGNYAIDYLLVDLMMNADEHFIEKIVTAKKLDSRWANKGDKFEMTPSTLAFQEINFLGYLKKAAKKTVKIGVQAFSFAVLGGSVLVGLAVVFENEGRAPSSIPKTPEETRDTATGPEFVEVCTYEKRYIPKGDGSYGVVKERVCRVKSTR